MPIHDWTRADDGLFHTFHQSWASELYNALNAGGLPAGFFALLELKAGLVPDVLAVRQRDREWRTDIPAGGVGLAEVAPRTRFVSRATSEGYASRANLVTIHHHSGDIVAIIEIVSPGNKSSQHALRSFVRKAAEFLRAGVHLLILDLFPPTSRDPQGLHKLIWDEFKVEPFELPPPKRLTLAAYAAGLFPLACVEPVAVGDILPEMPLFLVNERSVPAPLEASYSSAWANYPAYLKASIEGQPDSRR